MLMFKTYYPPPLYPLFQGFLTQLMSPYIRWIDSITAKTCPHFPLHADAPVRLFQLPPACPVKSDKFPQASLRIILYIDLPCLKAFLTFIIPSKAPFHAFFGYFLFKFKVKKCFQII